MSILGGYKVVEFLGILKSSINSLNQKQEVYIVYGAVEAKNSLLQI